MNDFKIIIDSTQGRTRDINLVRNNLIYDFDFTKFTNGIYELTYSFCSRPSNDLEETSDIAELNIDFGQNNVYKCVKNSTSSSSSNTIGLLYPNNTSGITSLTGYLNAKYSDNPPSIIRRPTTNNFNVKIIKNTGAVWADGINRELSDYTLILNFKYLSN